MTAVNQELVKSLNAAVDAALSELLTIDALQKGDVSLQDAKMRPEGANGDIPGHSQGGSALSPEDAKKAEEAKKAEDMKAEKAKKAEEAKKAFEEAKKAYEDCSKADEEDDEDDEDMDDDKAAKMEQKLEAFKAKKAASAGVAQMSKSDIASVAGELSKTVQGRVDELSKSFNERLGKLEEVLTRISTAAVPRASRSGHQPLAKSSEDVQATDSTQLSKGQALDKLFDLQKSGDTRVDSRVIARVEMGDFSVLSEKGIKLA